MVELSKPRLYLAKPDRTIIADLTNEAYDINHIIKLGSISDLNFKLPSLIEIDHVLVENEHINKILFKFLIKYEIDNYVEWFIINQSTPIMDEDIDVLQVECFSLPYELNNQDLKSYSVISKTLTQIMSDILSETNWSLGYINSSFELKYRSFEANCKVLEAVLNCATTFGAIIIFDSVQKEINFYLPEQIGNFNGLIFDYGKYLKSMNKSLDISNFCTRLKIYGQDSLTINEYNITGSNYLDDFSFFIYPYTEDSNGIALTHSNYMSDSLCHAILTYNALLLQKDGEYTGYLNTLEGYQVELTTLNNQLIVLQEQLAVIEDSLGVAQSSGNDTTSLLQQKSAKQTEITNKTTEITNKQAQINSVRSSISTLGSNLSMESNFTAEQLLELCDYIIVKEINNEYITDAKELIKWGKEEFLKISSPQILIELDIINFNQYLDEDCQLDKGKLILGDIVNIKYSKFGINVNAKITEINYDYENGDVSLIISNIETVNRDFDKFVKQMNQAMTTSMQVDMNKYKWNGTVDKTNEVEAILQNAWDTSLRQIKSGGSNEDIVIDSRGITATDPNDPLKALRIMHSTIGLTQDGFNTLGVAVNPSGVAAEYLIGRIIAGEKLTISSSDGSFEVYADENGNIKVDINNGALTINGGLSDDKIASANKWNNMGSVGMGVDADCLGLWHFDGSLNSHKGVAAITTLDPLFETGCFGSAIKPVGTSAPTWTNVVGCSVGSDNSVTKTAATAAWDAGAISTQSISSDGYVSTVVAETNTYRMIGFGNADVSQSYGDIEFAVCPMADGTLAVYESGAQKWSGGSYVTGDVLKVAVENGVVKYYNNSALLYTSAITPTFPLYVDTSLYTQGATLKQVNLYGQTQKLKTLSTGMLASQGTVNFRAKNLAAAANGSVLIDLPKSDNTQGLLCGISNTAGHEGEVCITDLEKVSKSYTETSQADFNTGTLTDVTATSAGNLEIAVASSGYGADVCSGGTAYAESQYSADYSASKAMDGSAATSWCTTQKSSAVTIWFAVKLSTAKAVCRVKILGRTDYPELNWKNFKIQGSNDSTNGADGTWTDLSTGLNTSATAQWDTFDFNNTSNYAWIRFTGLAQWFAPGSCYYISFSEVQMMEATTTYKTTGTREKIVDLSGANPAGGTKIEWSKTTPTNTAVKVETALSTDGGSTYGAFAEATSGSSIPNIASDTDLSNARLKIKETLSTTDTSVTPQLHSLTFTIWEKQATTVYGPNKSTLTAWDSISLAWKSDRLSLVVNETEYAIENPGLPSALGSYLFIGTDRNGANAINTLVDELRIDKVYKEVAIRTAWHKAGSPFYTSEDLRQLPGYLKAETDGYKVYDSSNNLRVLLGSWLKDAVRKYGLKIIDGEIHSSKIWGTEIRTGAEGATSYTKIGSVWNNPIEIIYENKPVLQVWGDYGRGVVYIYDASRDVGVGRLEPMNDDMGDGFRISATNTDGTNKVLGLVGSSIKCAGTLSMYSGSKNNVEQTENYGQRALTVRESPTQQYIDEDIGVLANGECRIDLDPILLECIEPNTDNSKWFIHLTPYADVSIFVFEKGADYFIVKEHDNGITTGAEFAWSLSATRKDYAMIRFMEVVD